MANFSADDVLIGEANWLVAPLGTTLPDDTSVDWNDFASWPAGWLHLGYTTAPTTMNYSYDEAAVDVQQSTAPIKRRKTSETLTLGTTLAQFNGDVLELVLQATATDTPAGVGQKAVTTIKGGGSTNLPEYMVGVETYRIDGSGNAQPVRVFLYKATIAASGDIPFDKSNAAGIPVTATGLADPNRTVGQQVFEIQIVTGPAS